MTAVTSTLAVLSVATLISLGQWLGDGMTAFEKKDYKSAAKSFTKVIEAEAQYNPVKDTALYMRARCFAKLKNKKDATRDLETLLKSGPHEKLLALAAADYKRITGEKWKGDQSTPEATWQLFLAALEDQDAAAISRCCSGQLGMELEEALNEPGFFQEVQGEIGPLLSVTYNRDKTRALVLFQEGGHRNDTEKVIMTKNGGVWTIAEEYNRRRHAAEFDGTPNKASGAEVAKDINNLRMLTAACEQYMLEFAKAPAQLEDAAMYVDDIKKALVSSTNGKPFAYANAGPNRIPWIFASSAVAGRRVAAINGRVANYPEEEFRKLAKQHGIKMPQHWKDTKVSKEDTAKIRKLIKQLGAESFKERKSAYAELQKIGTNAGKELEKATKDPDPEVSSQARQLLAEL